VVHVGIKHLDLVNDTTLAEVRYVVSGALVSHRSGPAHERVGVA
jgi:hypothetical protein